MKVIAVLILAVVALASARPEDTKYTNKYDNVDWKAIIASDRLTENYYLCLISKKSCPPDGQELKNIIPDALKSDCSKCSDKQKEAAKEIIHNLIKKHPDWWKELQAQFDPENIYYKKHEQELKAR